MGARSRADVEERSRSDTACVADIETTGWDETVVVVRRFFTFWESEHGLYAAIRRAREGRDDAFDLPGITPINRDHLDPQQRRSGFNGGELTGSKQGCEAPPRASIPAPSA